MRYVAALFEGETLCLLQAELKIHRWLLLISGKWLVNGEWVEKGMYGIIAFENSCERLRRRPT